VIIRPLVSMTSCLVMFAVAASAQTPIAPTPLPPVDVDVVVASAAQTPAPAQAPVPQPGAKTTQTTPTPQAPVTQVVPGPPKKIRGRDVNVQIELTITEHQGGAAGEKRVVSMIVADAAFGRIRSTASQDVKLNIDATPTMLDNDRIAL
jgi:hypothetical protein